MRNAMTAVLAIGLVMTVPAVARGASQGGPEGPPLRPDVEAGLQTRLQQDSGAARARVRVRVYDAGVMPAAEQTVALRAAAGVLAAAGIDVTWVPCGIDTCDTPLGRLELSVRFVRLAGTPSVHGQLQLGYSLVDTRMGEGTLATVYVDRVHWLAAQAGANTAVVLGFAVAHEIGHLLLGTNAHASGGLMRAIWARRELQHTDVKDWLFSRVEGVKMRASLAQRNGLRSSHRDATGCPAPDGDHPDASTGCDATADATALASLRGMAPGADR